MTQTDTHTYSSTEAVYEEIGPKYMQSKAYLTTVREEGMTAAREGCVAASSSGGNPTEGVYVDILEGVVQ